MVLADRTRRAFPTEISCPDGNSGFFADLFTRHLNCRAGCVDRWARVRARHSRGNYYMDYNHHTSHKLSPLIARHKILTVKTATPGRLPSGSFPALGVHPSVPRLPIVERCIAHSVLAAQICHFRTSVRFLEDRNDLLFFSSLNRDFLTRALLPGKLLDGPECRRVTDDRDAQRCTNLAGARCHRFKYGFDGRTRAHEIGGGCLFTAPH